MNERNWLQEGRLYVNNVFNETITILEDDGSFSTETGFLYIVFAGFIVLILFAVQHFLNKVGIMKQTIAD